MAEMVGSAVVQEVVSGAFSFMRGNHEEMASQSHLMERLEYANLEIKSALERTKRMPMIEVPLLQRRMMIKHAFEESSDLLCKLRTQRVNLEDEGADQQGVTLSPSLHNRIMHAVKPFLGAEKGSISGSCVRRFEWFAEKAGKFVTDVQSSFSLALYRFSSPIITQLLEGKCVFYEMVSGSQTCMLLIYPSCAEDYGVVAIAWFTFGDLKTPKKCFSLLLMLRLSESTDIVGIFTNCLKSLEPPFKPMADVACGELAQISTQVGFLQPDLALREMVYAWAALMTLLRQEPLCCIGDGLQHSAKNILPAKLSERFPEQVSLFLFECFISAAEYNLKCSTAETNRNTVKAWPILQLSVAFLPHIVSAVTSKGEFSVPLDYPDLSKIAKSVPMVAADRFMIEPERTEYSMPCRYSAHGYAVFTVSKPTTEMGRAPKVGDGSKTRRASKRKR
jgi:hypothetical protein